MYLTVEQRGVQICLLRAMYAPRKSTPLNSRIFLQPMIGRCLPENTCLAVEYC